MSASSTTELLIHCLQPDTEPAAWQAQLASADTEKFTVSAIVLGLAPLIQRRLRESNVALPPRASARLLAAGRAAAARQDAILAQLAEVLDACAGAHVDLIALKGIYLATHVYPVPGMRPMNDIDVLVRPEQLPALEALLLRLGYEAHYKSPERGARVVKHTSTFRKPGGDGATPNPYLSASAERTLEPHTSLEESWFGLRADVTPGVWERSVPIGFPGIAAPARALCPSDLLLHLSVHLTFHLIMGYPSLVQLVDLLMLSGALAPQDWQSVVPRARTHRVSPFVYAALRLAWLALHAPIPGEVIGALAAATPPRVRAHAETFSVGDLMQRTQRPPLNTLPQRIGRGVQERAEVARWTGSLTGRAAVWRTLLDVGHTDTSQLIAERVRQWRGGGAAKGQ